MILHKAYIFCTKLIIIWYMCLAIPGKITHISKGQATVSYPGQSRPALIGDQKVKVGDYVLVQMGIIIQKLSANQAKSRLQGFL
ncbi:hypothetical protein A2397_03075 [Candidatus Amesbacteria bacterium RIFOXYB1_FULL_44_23]|uniref:Uncharacterized protein n=1 Tax=Candidatus Amesbacteria bacterium RIFOXYB1_FULL_44_23 TaxID=1797263 RepID=A0A1F4ZR92_9BACT|nr:MAG: hypothetical protein A2397_03075 [Candidatus Amesbacteria bacterium RIFOXYB1_FULL_44_23]